MKQEFLKIYHINPPEKKKWAERSKTLQKKTNHFFLRSSSFVDVFASLPWISPLSFRRVYTCLVSNLNRMEKNLASWWIFVYNRRLDPHKLKFIFCEEPSSLVLFYYIRLALLFSAKNAFVVRFTFQPPAEVRSLPVLLGIQVWHMTLYEFKVYGRNDWHTCILWNGHNMNNIHHLT